jgi:site-specific DNA recombinase
MTGMTKIIRSKEKKRFVIYTRCSTDDQAQGDFTTLDAQAHHCKNMLDAFGYELGDIGKNGIINDDGYSGKDLNRPGIQTILENVRQKKIDGIIFFRLDRLTRNTRDLYSLIDLFREKEVDFISVRENLDSSTAIGRVVIGILGILSAFERELTGERVKASAIARVRQGKWVGGFLAHGYKLEKDGERLPNGRQPHKVVLDPELAPKLRIIWEMAANNKSLMEIGQELERQNVRTCRGKVWRKQTLSSVIKNPFYKGYILYANELHKGNHEAMIEPAIWEKANRIVKAKLPGHGFSRKPKTYNYLLSGLLKCGKCGSHLISASNKGRDGKKFHYYICGRSKQKLGCNELGIPAPVFDRALIGYFRKASQNREIIIKGIGDAMREAQLMAGRIDTMIAETESKLNECQHEAKTLLDLAMTGTVTQGTAYKTKMSEIDNQIIMLEDKLTKLRTQKTANDMTANSANYLHETLQFALEYLDKAPADAQKSLIFALIKEIVIHSDVIDLRMYLGDPEQTLQADIHDCDHNKTAVKNKNPVPELLRNGADVNDQALVAHGRPKWLPLEDSNLGPGGYT